MQFNEFKRGLKDALPIGLAYFAVSFAFGISACSSGLTILEATFLSLTNLTSAGQFAAVPIICSNGSYTELIVSQLVINLRYSLMSVILSQKLDEKVNFKNKLLIAFFNTDEIFALAVNNEKQVEKEYMYGTSVLPIAGWTLGTFSGALAGDILPLIITNSLSVAIYAMFVAIVIPNVSKEKSTLISVIIGIILSCIFYYCFKNISFGFSIVICSIVACTITSLLFPLKENENE